MDNYMQEIEKRIQRFVPGRVFINHDFIDLATYDVVRQSLSRLVKKGVINRLLRGIYMVPNHNEILGVDIPAKVSDVAEAIARKNSWVIIPMADASLNYLGLTTQVPAVYTYVSSGPTKSYKYNNFELKFNKRSAKYINNKSKITAIVIEALKTIKKGNVSDKDRRQIVSVLSKDDLSCLYDETRLTDFWINEEIIQILKIGGYDVRSSENDS